MISTEEILEVKANKRRAQLGIGIADPIDPYKALVELNVITNFRPMSTNFSGMAMKAGENLFILVNNNQTKARQNFTIGHELYHLLEQPNFSFKLCQVGRFDKKDKEEYNADTYSSFLLLPTAGMLSMIPENEQGRGGQISLATIVKLEQYFGVSRHALLVRLSKMGWIKYAEYEQYLSGVKQSANQLGYNVSLYEPSRENNIIGDYGALCKKLFEQQKISESHYYNLMMDIGVDIDKTFEENEWDW